MSRLDWGNHLPHRRRNERFQRMSQESSRRASDRCAAACPPRPGCCAEEPVLSLVYGPAGCARRENATEMRNRSAEEALGMRHNHAQLYLNLAEVYHQAGRQAGRDLPRSKRTRFRGPRFPHSPRARAHRQPPRAGVHVPASQPSAQSHARQVAPPLGRPDASGLRIAAPSFAPPTMFFPVAVVGGGLPRERPAPDSPLLISCCGLAFVAACPERSRKAAFLP